MRLAQAIAADVIENQISAGTRLGSLPEVARQYGISVPTLRKAITFLQEDGIVVSREGRGGGLVVGSPPAETAVKTMYDFFNALGVTLQQVKEARDLMDVVLAERACRFADAEFLSNVERIFDAARAEGADLRQSIREFDSIILGAARQPVFALISRVLGQLEIELDDTGSCDLTHEWDLRYACSRSIVASNLADAIKFRRLLRPVAERRLDRNRTDRLGDRVVDAVKALINDRGLRPGDELGREGELQELFGVGQITLRDALRPLERSGIVQVMQGRKGGIFAGAVQPYAAIEMISLYLSSINLSFDAQIESRQILQPRAAWLAAERIDNDLIDRLRAAIDEETAAIEAKAPDSTVKALAVERLIASACGNPLIEFFTLVHIEFSMIQTRKIGAPLARMREQVMDLVSAHHRLIANQIMGKFPAKAAFAARQFLKELGAIVRQSGVKANAPGDEQPNGGRGAGPDR